MSRSNDKFDYEEARRDLWDNGCDPDYLSEYDSPEERDRFLRDCGLDPAFYGSTYEPETRGRERESGFSLFADFGNFSMPEEDDGESEWADSFADDLLFDDEEDPDGDGLDDDDFSDGFDSFF